MFLNLYAIWESAYMHGITGVAWNIGMLTIWSEWGIQCRRTPVLEPKLFIGSINSKSADFRAAGSLLVPFVQEVVLYNVRQVRQKRVLHYVWWLRFRRVEILLGFYARIYDTLETINNQVLNEWSETLKPSSFTPKLGQHYTIRLVWELQFSKTHKCICI